LFILQQTSFLVMPLVEVGEHNAMASRISVKLGSGPRMLASSATPMGHPMSTLRHYQEHKEFLAHPEATKPKRYIEDMIF